MRNRALRGSLIAALTAIAAWGVLAVWFDGPANRPLAAALAAVFLAAVLLPPLRYKRSPTAIAGSAVAFGLLLAWWLGLRPSNDRQWQADVARTPTAEIHGSAVTLHDLRNFDYRSETDFAERWESRRYDLGTIEGLDLFVSYWGPTLYAHTILSWGFRDALPLAISIETRKQRGESYSALGGFFRQYELVYVAADERDVVRLRTSFRGERVLLYRLTTPPVRARALLERTSEKPTRWPASPPGTTPSGRTAPPASSAT